MAILIMEGFDWQPTGNQVGVALNNKFTTGNPTFPWFSSIGQFANGPSLNNYGGKSGNFNNAGSQQVFWGTNVVTGVQGIRYKMPNSMPSNSGIFTLYDASTVQIGIATNASRQIFAYRNTVATVLGTGTTQLMPGGIYFIEFKATIDPTVGAITVKIDGFTELTLTNQNTRNTGNSFYQGVRIESLGQSTGNVDDFYVLDTTGPAPQNDFLSLGGPVVIETSFPTTNNSVTFTPNASTNVSQVLETAMDGDATFNVSSTNGQIDTFNHAALNGTPATIYAVAIQASMRKDDATSQFGRTKLISGGTTQNGVSFQTINALYAHIEDIYRVDPNTSAAWIAANVNATKIGYEHV